VIKFIISHTAYSTDYAYLIILNFKPFLLALDSIDVSFSQAVINFNMIAIKEDRSSTSVLTRYSIAKLDRSKATGERCIDSGECRSFKCLTTGFCSSMINTSGLIQKFSHHKYFFIKAFRIIGILNNQQTIKLGE